MSRIPLYIIKQTLIIQIQALYVLFAYQGVYQTGTE